MSNTYWQDRLAQSQDKLSRKNLKEIEKQFSKYYASAARKVIDEFEAVYNKILAQTEAGKEITPADLYKLNKYWEMQGQMRQELRKLGEKQIATLTKQFEVCFFDVYYSIALQGLTAFSTISTEDVQQLINHIWVADGKTFSQRVWDNVELLTETLNEELVHCVVTGKKSTELKNILQDRFNVSYSNADMIARTEIAHVQTQAAQKRYEDYGIKEVMVWADPDERTCDICGKLHEKKIPANGNMPIPAHPRCRCCIIPVVD